MVILYAMLWNFADGRPVSLSALNTLHPGMTETECIAAIGRPSEIEMDENSIGKIWYYRRFWLMNYLVVRFDENGRFLDYANEP